MKISLIDMRKTKKRNTRESIISILGREFPLTIRKVYNKIKKDYHFEVTYQAIFKLVKEMLSDGILIQNEHEYQLNMQWIKQLEDELEIIKKNYNEEQKENPVQERVNNFVSILGPKIKEYIGKDEAVIIAVSGGGKIFAINLWKYLAREGINIKFHELHWFEQAKEDLILTLKKDIENKKVVFVDSELYSGKTYHVVMDKINKLRTRLKIKDIKFIADIDMQGLADMSISKA